MNIFNPPNTSNNWECPICKTNKKAPVALIPIMGTEKDNNIEALQIHIDCINLIYVENSIGKLLLQILEQV